MDSSEFFDKTKQFEWDSGIIGKNFVEDVVSYINTYFNNGDSILSSRIYLSRSLSEAQYLVHFKIHKKYHEVESMFNKLEEELLELGIDHNIVYFGHSNWFLRLKLEDLRDSNWSLTC